MASYKLQYNPASRQTRDRDPTFAQRTPSTRLPTRTPAYTTSTPSQSSATTRSVSKLTKKAPSSREDGPSTKDSNKHRLPASRTLGTEDTRGNTAAKVPYVSPHGIADSAQSKNMPYPISSRAARLEPPANPRTPSLISGSSASTMDSPRSNLLRRKPSSIGRQPQRTGTDSSASSHEEMVADSGSSAYSDPFPEAVLGITMPPSSGNYLSADKGNETPELQLSGFDPLSQMLTHDMPPPTPPYVFSTASPSSGYTESPGPFSHTSTPTSMSSMSPSVVMSSKLTTRTTQMSPTQRRPGTARRGTNDSISGDHALPSVRESSTSSSSSSTVRASDGIRRKESARRPSLPAPPPTPPHRKMSAGSAEIRISQPIQTPPEFAHLAGPPAISTQAPTRPAPPRRPSREGTPDMSNLQQPSPVIQSNLSKLPTTAHRRQSSTESRSGSIPGITPDSRSRFGLAPTKTSSRNPSPSPSAYSASFSPLSPTTSARSVSAQRTTPDIPSDGERGPSRVKASTLPSPSKPTSRFGFFSRRTKTDPVVSTTKEDKKARKGPVAGTGHEGYGRFAFTRGRSGSSTSGGNSVGRSSSTDSTSGTRAPSTRKSSVESKAGSEIDDFLLERLNPVTIRGEGRVPLSKTQTQGSQGSSGQPRPGFDASRSNSFDTNPEDSKPVLLPSPMPDQARVISPTKRNKTAPPSASDQKGRLHLPTLASRRSSRLSQLPGDNSAGRIPTTINTSTTSLGSSTGSYRPRKGSIPNTANSLNSVADLSEGKESKWSKTKRTEAAPPTQTKSKSRWNIFQKSSSTLKKEKKVPDLAAAAARQAPSRTVAHYALMDPDDRMDLTELDQLMQEANMSDDQGQEFHPFRMTATKSAHGNSILLPEPPVFVPEFAAPQRSASPKVTLRSEKSETGPPEPMNSMRQGFPAEPVAILSGPMVASPKQLDTASPHQSPQTQPKPNRLPRVGRIPQVVPKTDRERKLSDSSFSRPFVPSQPSPALGSPRSSGTMEQILSIVGQSHLGSETLGHSDARSPIFNPGAPFENPVGAVAGSVSPEASRNGEFFAFPPRKNSEMSTSSSSGIITFQAPTAIIPPKGAPPGEDEIWNEYDDLLDEVMSPKLPVAPLSASCSAVSLCETDVTVFEQSPIEETTPGLNPPSRKFQLPRITAPDGRPISNGAARPLSSLPSIVTPTSPYSITDFLAAYGDKGLSVIDPCTGRLSIPSNGRFSNASARLSLPSTIASSSYPSPLPKPDSKPVKHNPYRDTRLIEDAENQSNGQESMAHLRFVALMTSKWLSFGRVLFSPAHFELKDKAEDRVLIIDGLGKDWSYYVALTYPNATIYYLSATPTSSTSTSPRNSGPFGSLPNHRQIYHPSLNSPFPFPKGFFAACVFRFPPVSPESTYRSAMFECKRVLRPGGYLEIAALDIDMLNMGNRARRAVRGLKVRMQTADSGVSLKPVSDTVQRLLGRRGFEGLRSCMVGVPAAGGVLTNGDGSPPNTESSTCTPTESSDGPSINDTGNISDLLSSNSGDEGITKMIARVGRWWYSRCYESMVLPNGWDAEKSIWSDKAVLDECEKRGTSFRMLICYAQKPDVVVRRTVSV